LRLEFYDNIEVFNGSHVIPDLQTGLSYLNIVVDIQLGRGQTEGEKKQNKKTYSHTLTISIRICGCLTCPALYTNLHLKPAAKNKNSILDCFRLF
jgi:hypothetical protein